MIACRASRSPRRPGDPIAYHPDVKRMLLEMKSRIEAMRALAYFTAGKMDVAHLSPDVAEAKAAQATVDLLIPVVKGWCTENSIQIASTGVQVHGGMGFIEETGAAQHLRDARITTIYEGTTAIQANDFIGRKIARDGGVAAKTLIGEIEADLRAWASSDIAALAKALAAPLGRFAQAVDWIVATHKAAPEKTAASAVPMLHLAGITFGYWLVLRQAAAAIRRREAGEDPKFAEGKLAYATFYAAHVLPQTESFFIGVVEGADAITAFDPSLMIH